MTRILVVDDEIDLAQHIAEELQTQDIETGIAFNGVDAVLKVLDESWNVVLMDIRMPKLDGIGALRIMKRISPNLPVIMFTGQAGHQDIDDATRLGAITCLLKPVSIEKLMETLWQTIQLEDLN